MLRTKCITAPAERCDGLRISVMSRHTLNDGITPDPNITADSYDQHWQDLAPPPRLVGGYLRGEIPWEDFRIQYRQHLWTPDAYLEVVRLAELVCRHNATIMCEEQTPDYCHRGLIAERVRELVPDVDQLLQ